MSGGQAGGVRQRGCPPPPWAVSAGWGGCSSAPRFPPPHPPASNPLTACLPSRPPALRLCGSDQRPRVCPAVPRDAWSGGGTPSLPGTTAVRRPAGWRGLDGRGVGGVSHPGQMVIMTIHHPHDVVVAGGALSPAGGVGPRPLRLKINWRAVFVQAATFGTCCPLWDGQNREWWWGFPGGPPPSVRSHVGLPPGPPCCVPAAAAADLLCQRWGMRARGGGGSWAAVALAPRHGRRRCYRDGSGARPEATAAQAHLQRRKRDTTQSPGWCPVYVPWASGSPLGAWRNGGARGRPARRRPGRILEKKENAFLNAVKLPTS